jgi:hypothetical protein
VSCVDIELAIAYAIIPSTKRPEFVLRESLDICSRLLVLCVAEEYTGDDLRLDPAWKLRDSRVHDSGSLAIFMLVSTCLKRSGATSLYPKNAILAVGHWALTSSIVLTAVAMQLLQVPFAFVLSKKRAGYPGALTPWQEKLSPSRAFKAVHIGPPIIVP